MKNIDHEKIESLKEELKLKIEELNNTYSKKIKEAENSCKHELGNRRPGHGLSYSSYGEHYVQKTLIYNCKYCGEDYKIEYDGFKHIYGYE